MVKRLKVTLTRLAYLVLIVFLVMSIAPGSARAGEVNCTTNNGYNLNLDNGTIYKSALDEIWEEITDGNSDSRKTKNVNTCFLVPVSKYGDKYVDFIVRSRDLYILGFRAENKIYTFDDQDPNIIPVVPGTQKVELRYGGNYNSIYRDPKVRQKEFGSDNIIAELNTLKKAATTPDSGKFKTGLAYGAFFLSESLRFKPVNTTFVKVFSDQNTKITFNDKLDPYVFKWGDCSQAYLFGTDPQKESARKLLKTANGNVRDTGTIPTCPKPKNNPQSSH